MAFDITRIVSTLFLPVALWLYTSYMSSTAFPTLRGKRIVLLIAHPDDEAMFFAPTVLALTKPDRQNHLKILCLSSGNADGVGEVRKNELSKSAEVLGMRREDVLVLDDPYFVNSDQSRELQDSLSTAWPTAYISSLLVSTFAPLLASTPPTSAPTSTIDALITFDENGVSSHPNHTSCYEGAVAFLTQLMSKHAGWQCPVAVYSLRSVNTLRKYIGVADAVVSVIRAILGLVLLKDREKRGAQSFVKSNKMQAQGDRSDKDLKESPSWLLFVSGIQDWFRAQRAMVQCHKSQMVWFRWGWIGIGRYMIVNDLRRLKV